MSNAADTQTDDCKQQFRHPVDGRLKPEWGTALDGRSVKITTDDRFDGLWQEWLRDACAHPREVLLRWVNAGGQTVHKRYCYDCGSATSNFIKKEDAEREGISEVEKDRLASISRVYAGERETHLERLTSAAAERCQPGTRSTYDDYLRSDAWKRKVAKIMERAAGVCEGCLSRPADHVHHLTYAHIYAEFAFELVAICAPCHARLHSSEAA